MSKPDLWVLTTAPGYRYEEAALLFAALGTPINRRVMVTNVPDVLRATPEIPLVLTDETTGINISRWWTLGLDYIASQYGSDDIWDVLIIETDARITPAAVDTIRDHMRTLDVVMAGADWLGVLDPGQYHVRRDNSAWTPEGRMPGIALVVAGETGIRHDPEFRWWLADDDFEWQHRVGGGTVLVGGLTIAHVGTQGPLTGERKIAFEEDQIKFMAKWGGMPVTGGIVPSEAKQA